jgi:calcium-dependent protein kinase
LLSAVAYCHERNIIHRDLKLENLILESRRNDANLKVIDFGTSRKVDPKEKLSRRIGTVIF